MDRRQLLKGIATLTLGQRLVALNEARAATGEPASPGVHEVSGKLLINGRPAAPGIAVRPGDTVSTGGDSHAIYMIGRDVHLQRERSVIHIASSGLRVVSGKLLSVFGKGDKKILTPTATIGIRGTACYIETGETSTYFCLCYGKAEIVPSGRPDAGRTIETLHHDHPMSIDAAGEQMALPATVRNHADSELILLEALAGRRPPFVDLGLTDY